MICKVWGVGMFSIVALTTSNILLTLRLMHGRDDGGFLGGGGGGGCGGSISDAAPHSWTAALSSTNHSEYLTFLKAAAINTAAQAPPENEVVLNDDKGTTDSSEAPQAGVGAGAASGPSLLLGTGFKIEESTGRWDVRRRYKIHDHVFTGPQYPRLTRESPVCLATQTSVDRLFWLTQVARYWTSPMSVAVFTPDVEYAIARAYLTYLVTCFPFLGEKVTFHFTYPRDHLPKDMPLVIDHLEGKCDQPLAVLKELLKQRNSKMLMWRERMPYPQNVVRNVARKNCGTEWVFLADVDIVPLFLVCRTDWPPSSPPSPQSVAKSARLLSQRTKWTRGPPYPTTEAASSAWQSKGAPGPSTRRSSYTTSTPRISPGKGASSSFLSLSPPPPLPLLLSSYPPLLLLLLLLRPPPLLLLPPPSSSFLFFIAISGVVGDGVESFCVSFLLKTFVGSED
ncbi:uncharacterized protein LOC135226256 [Macrobrachium nipponense]|uniref:uncharacterized protein LOC135226256 n=1 Tax=Macrobrachium nipponense TaxID=159736 RepID=UPI0030C7E4DC